ncbi:hypothetical protein [Ammoniphilus sp. 3BR4]|uniref:hypothetical protein n=1 Tax=Ammoniphilus sp. 3BR4 TaxID=3158265 RepID=UPI003464FAB1
MSRKIKKSILRKLDKKIRKLIKKKKVIGSGKARIVYDLGHGKVLKVAKKTCGVKDNENEVNIYKSSSSSIRKHLARIKDHGTGWLIMKKVHKEFPRSIHYKKKLLKLKHKLKRHGIIPADILTRHNNPKRSNLRIKKGKIIVIDYGKFKLKS